VDVEADCLELDSWADVGDALARELAGALRGVRACQLHQPLAMNTQGFVGTGASAFTATPVRLTARARWKKGACEASTRRGWG